MTGSDGERQDRSTDPEARRVHRAERARRVRRRRLIAAAVVVAVLIVAGAAIAAIRSTEGDGGGDEPAAAVTTDAPTASTSAPAPATAPATPTAEQQAAAVARVRSIGLPLYRTPGRGRGVVALTFDDGPGPYTRKTVETLRANGMRATFFLVGREVVSFPDDPAIEATVAALGDHTWNHPSLPDLPAARARSEIARTQAIVERASGAPVRLFRAPYGARTRAIDATAEELGMIQVLWSVDSGDSEGIGWKKMLRKVEAQIGPGDIVLFHENRGQTQKVINRLIPWMTKRGLRSVSVPELLALDPPSKDYLRREAGRYRPTA